MENHMPSAAKIQKKYQKTTFLSADDTSLTEKDLEKAFNELNETEDRKKNCLQKLRIKLSNDKINYRTDDEYLLRFLRVRKFDTDKAFKTIQDFYSVRRKHHDVFDLPPNLESLLNMNFFVRLPYVDEDGRILFTVDYGKWNPAEVPFFKLMNFITVVSDIITKNPKSQINGIVTIVDLKELGPSHLAQFLYPRRVMLFVKILQSCYPWRIKAIIGVNCGIVTQTLYKLFQPFMKKKIRERVFLFGSDMKELHQYVNPAVLPKQLGGELEESECSITQQVLDNISYLKYERSFGTDSASEK